MYQSELGKALTQKRAKDKGKSFPIPLSQLRGVMQDFKEAWPIRGGLIRLTHEDINAVIFMSQGEVSFQRHRADLPIAATPNGWDRLSSPLTNEMSFVGTLADGAAWRMSRQQTHEMRGS